MKSLILAKLILFSALLFSSIGFSQESGSIDSIRSADGEKVQKTVNISSDTSSIKESEFKPNITPELHINKIPNNSIIIDGKIIEEIWKEASVADNFTEINPGDNVKPEVDTKVYVAYDDDAIYFAYICYDDMSTVRGSMCDRDFMYQDDWVGPFIDTYNDEKQAFEFYVNPQGIQGDLFWTVNNEDSSPDYIYESETQRYNDRWTAEIRIPFKSLKFPDTEEQTWRVHLLRNRVRGARQRIYWASVSRDNPNFLGQAGIFKGIKNIKRGKNLEIMPYIAGNQTSAVNNSQVPVLEHDKVNLNIGGTLKYGISSTTTLDFTYNPDFSQIEADAQIIDANNPFALFLQEKRPFFLEGSSVFNVPGNIVYTRAINNPLFASKITGRIGKYEFGYMNAYDQNTTFLVPLEEKTYIVPSNRKSLSNILRVKYDLGNESFVGMIYSDREFTKDSTKSFDFSGYNRIIGINWRYAFASNYLVIGQALGYSTKELNDTALFNEPDKFGSNNQYNAAFNGESYNGLGGFLAFSRRARNWWFYNEASYSPPVARKDNGFISRNNIMDFYFEQGYSIYPEGKVVNDFTPNFWGYLRWDTKGAPREQFLQLQTTVAFANGIYIYPAYLAVNNEVYGGINHRNVNRWRIGSDINSFKLIRGGFNYEKGKYIVRQDNPYVGNGQILNFWFTFLPIDRIRMDFEYSYEDVSQNGNNAREYAGYVMNNKVTYQIDKHFACRLVTQYNSFSNSFNFDPLISYKWNPFTVLYVGSTHSFEEFSGANNHNFYKESYRQIFLKFQYLWSL